MGKVAILTNPGSTQNSTQLTKLTDRLDRASNVMHFELTDIGDISEALRQFARVSPDILAINGGDGTVQAVLTCLCHEKPFGAMPPPIAVIPSGKTNLIAADLGGTGRPMRVLEQILDIAGDPEMAENIVTKHLIELDMGNGEPSRFGMFFGASAVVSAIYYTRAKIYPLGLPNAISHALVLFKIGVAIFGGGRAPDSPLYTAGDRINVVGGGVIEGRHILTLVTTLDQLLFGLRPFSDRGKGGLRFICIEHRPGAFLRGLWATLRGRIGAKYIPGVHLRRADKIVIEGKDSVTLDGEIYEPLADTPITLHGDRSLSFVRI